MAKQNVARRNGRSFVTLTVSFDNLDNLKEFVDAAFPEDVAVYNADALDREFIGHVPAGAFVVRHKGQKPDQQLA